MLAHTVEIVARCLAVAGILGAIAFLTYGRMRGQNLKREMDQKQRFRKQYANRAA